MDTPPEPFNAEQVIVFDGLHNLRVYTKHGTVLSLDNVEILLDPDPEEKLLRIFVWRRKSAQKPVQSSRPMEVGKQDKKTEEG